MTAEWAATKADPSNSQEKIATLSNLGFRVENGTVTAPSYLEFVSNYIRLARINDVGLEHTPLPALVFVRGRIGSAVDHLLVTPGVDPWPSESGMRLLSADEMFNIPFRATLDGLQKNRFPLLEASHDVSHFMSFLMNPGYTKALQEKLRSIPKLEKYPIGFGRRLFYALEILSLANPGKKREIADTLIFPGAKGPYSKRTFKEYISYFDALPMKDVAAQGERLVQSYEYYLNDYGGGVTRSGEKNLLVTDGFAGVNSAEGALLHILGSRRSDIESIIKDASGHTPVVVLSQLLALRTLPAEEVDKAVRTNSFLMEYFYVEPKLDSVLAADYQLRMDALVRLQVARMEFFLWESANSVTAEKWINETLSVRMDQQSEVINFVRDIFGTNSVLYKSMIGRNSQ